MTAAKLEKFRRRKRHRTGLYFGWGHWILRWGDGKYNYSTWSKEKVYGFAEN